ncbi:MAG: biosynthetic arginine decarboxylase, partial [Gammaproteobacteria bacterium]
PSRDAAHGQADLAQLAADIQAEGLSLPVLVRFTGILRDRVDTLIGAFEQAREQQAFGGHYTAVYPIKVNQQRAVVGEIVAHGDARVGLEAGSKPELMAVLGIARPGMPVVCNGYKDREYLRVALIGQQLGHKVYVVVEKPAELGTLIREARAMGVRPAIGVRVRLASVSAGKWQNTGGEKSKFGLSPSQLLEAVDTLRAADLLDCLELLHVHLGSQVANIRDIQRGMREASRYYAELHRLGAKVKVMDVGGGLGVDYEGTRSRSYCSMNYTVQQYAQTIVREIRERADENDLPHPDLISESGRALTAHHAVLITDVTDVERIPETEPTAPAGDEPLILQDLWETLENAGRRTVLEVYQDAVYFIGEAQSMYTHGLLTLEQRAHADRIYHAICRRVRNNLTPGQRSHRDILDELNEKLADKFFCNFSVFQSLPDVWAINQVFPIMPLQRLDEPTTRRGVLRDLTCDSDGRIDQYVDREGLEATLPVHEIGDGESYLLGFFMVGAYQEILGDMHNLFGDTDSVNVELDGDGRWRFTGEERGDTADELLRYVHFDPAELLANYRAKTGAADLDPATREQYLRELEDGLSGYTYLEK